MSLPLTDVLRPSPLDLGGVLSGTFRILRQRLASFVVLTLIPGGLALVLVLLAMIPLTIGIITAIEQSRFSGLIVLGALLMIAAIIVASLAQIKVQAMMVLGAHDTIHGQTSTVGDLYRRTAGVVGRVLLLVLLIAVVWVVFFGIVGLVFGVGLFGMMTNGLQADSEAMIGTLIVSSLLFMVVMFALGVAIFYLQVRFLYFVPGLAVENRTTVDALKRSWHLTKGNVLRTLGYYLVGSFLVGAVASVFQFAGQILAIPSSAGTGATDETAAAQALALLPLAIILSVLQLAVQILAVPFLACYLTVMYVDQLRRDQLPAGWRPGQWGPPPGPGMSGPPAQPGSYGQGPPAPGSYGQGVPGQSPYGQGSYGQGSPGPDSYGPGSPGQQPPEAGPGSNPWSRPGDN